MKVLFVAPLPPPISGHALASEVFLKHLLPKYEVCIVDLNKKSKKKRFNIPDRILEVVRILLKIFKNRSKCQVIYFTISESLGGNLKDILIYLICYRQLSCIFLHLHGGSIKQHLFNKSKLLYHFNKFFISKMGGVIVLGDSHRNIFQDMISSKKIHTVPNFAEDFLFLTKNEIITKFSNISSLKLVFITNLLLEKGYRELLYAFLQLAPSVQDKISIDFAGRFNSDLEKKFFLKKLSLHKNLKYHGIVHGKLKNDLFQKGHIFCLPTSFLEGQPIAILEAYAAGCVVLTTLSGGIADIFQNKVNGYVIEKRSTQSVINTLNFTLANQKKLLDIAIKNNLLAKNKYRTKIYNSSLENILFGKTYKI